jgi:hypothetical protein
MTVLLFGMQFLLYYGAFGEKGALETSMFKGEECGSTDMSSQNLI